MFLPKSLGLHREWKTFEKTGLLLCIFKGFYCTSCKESWSKRNSSLLLDGWTFSSPNSLRHSISCSGSWQRVRHLVLLPTGIGVYTAFLRRESRFRTYLFFSIISLVHLAQEVILNFFNKKLFVNIFCLTSLGVLF